MNRYNLQKQTGNYVLREDSLSRETFNFFKQELDRLRFYNNALRGTIYNVTIDDTYINEIQNFTPYQSIEKSTKITFVDKIYTGSNPNILTDFDTLNNEYSITDRAFTILVTSLRTDVVLSNDIDPETFFNTDYVVVETNVSNTQYSFLNNLNGLYRYNPLTKQVSRVDDFFDKEKQFNLYYDNNDIYLLRKNRIWSAYPLSDIDDVWLDIIDIESIRVIRNNFNYFNINDTIINHFIYDSLYERHISVGTNGLIYLSKAGMTGVVFNYIKENLVKVEAFDNNIYILTDKFKIIVLDRQFLTIKNVVKFDETDILLSDSNDMVIIDGIIHIVGTCGTFVEYNINYMFTDKLY